MPDFEVANDGGGDVTVDTTELVIQCEYDERPVFTASFELKDLLRMIDFIKESPTAARISVRVAAPPALNTLFDLEDEEGQPDKKGRADWKALLRSYVGKL